ncbi:hypothetical protein LCGC14_1251500 [marine sediment metagenome]|uniref:Uncharacterized protein n=1 Tax=marine sediment metagenome TaxID=412755 RepID=A0A0F9L2Z7_9ZZZZ
MEHYSEEHKNIYICRNYELGEEDGFKYEDKLIVSPTLGMHAASHVHVEGVRLYPYIVDFSGGTPIVRYISLGYDVEMKSNPATVG